MDVATVVRKLASASTSRVSRTSRVGLQDLYPFTFGHREIDGAGRQGFLWQSYRPADVELTDAVTGERVLSPNGFRLDRTQPALELNGLGGGRLYYAIGISQGAGGLGSDNDGHKDVFYKLRYKIGGLRLDGLYDSDGSPTPGSGGQLLDRSITIEHFGYLGAEPVDGGRTDEHRSVGVSARALHGPVDVGIGFVWGRNDNPWGEIATSAADYADASHAVVSVGVGLLEGRTPAIGRYRIRAGAPTEPPDFADTLTGRTSRHPRSAATPPSRVG